MITLTLQRNRPTGKAVTGTLILPFEEGQRSAPTLENADYLIPGASPQRNGESGLRQEG